MEVVEVVRLFPQEGFQQRTAEEIVVMQRVPLERKRNADQLLGGR